MLVLGTGQMGLICAGLLVSQEPPSLRHARGSAAPTAGLARPVRVVLWGHERDEADALAQSRRSRRLPRFLLPPEVEVTSDASVAATASLVVSAIPVQYSRAVWTRIGRQLPRWSGRGAGIVSVAKGIEVRTLMRPTQVIADVLRKLGRDDPDLPARPLGVLSGPTIAAELARSLPASMIAASDDPAFAAQIQRLFSATWLRIYTSDDVLGVEVAGACKNIIAIAAGILDGLKAGNNAKSALLARGLVELARLGAAMGASPETFFGLAGLGDLATSCFSPEGRNRSCGEALGKGVRLRQYLARSESVVEGVQTTRAVVRLARKYRVEMPIVEAVHSVLFKRVDPIEAITRLMSREMKAERVR